MALSKKQTKFTIFIHGDYKIVTLFKIPALWPTSDVYQILYNSQLICISGLDFTYSHHYHPNRAEAFC
jgi:hypothetical protein